MSEVSQAYLKLIEISERSRQHAHGLPEQEQAKSIWSGVGFTLNDRRYVAPMDEVSEILTVPRYTQVPGVQSWVKGIANFFLHDLIISRNQPRYHFIINIFM